MGMRCRLSQTGLGAQPPIPTATPNARADGRSPEFDPPKLGGQESRGTGAARTGRGIGTGFGVAGGSSDLRAWYYGDTPVILWCDYGILDGFLP